MRSLALPVRSLGVLLGTLALASCGSSSGSSGGGDNTPPGPVTALVASYSAAAHQVTLTWTNPVDADFGGVLIARSVGAPVAGTPAAKTTYAPGNFLPGGGTVLATGNMSAALDVAPPTGQVHYAVFAHDNVRNYAPAAHASVSIDVSQATANLLTGTLTLASPVPAIAVSGTVTDDGGGNATVNLTLTNNGARLLFNLKAVVRAMSTGTASGDGFFQGSPYVYFGPAALGVGANVGGSFTVSGLAGTTFTFTVELVDHKMLVLQGDGPSSTPALLDSSGTGERTDLDTDNLTAFFQDSNHQGALFSPDGRFLYLANGNQPALVVVDMLTLAPVLTADLTGANMLQTDGLGSVGMAHGLAMSPGGQFLYTVLTEGAHSGAVGFGGSISGAGVGSRLGVTTTVSLVKIDRVTLAEVSRVVLFTDVTAGSVKGGKGLSISADGARAAVPITNAGVVFVVDLASMTIFDADLVVPGSQPFDVSGHSMSPRHTAFSPSGDEVFVAHSKGDSGDLDVLDLNTRTISPLPLSPAFAGKSWNQVGSLVLGPDDRLYYTHPFDSSFPGLSIFDFGSATWTDLHAAPFRGLGEVLFDADGGSYWVQDMSSSGDPVHRFQIGTNAAIPMEASGLPSFPGPSGATHCAAISPF